MRAAPRSPYSFRCTCPDRPRRRARLWGTAAVCDQMIALGADVLRVYDVGPIVQTARMADALWRPLHVR